MQQFSVDHLVPPTGSTPPAWFICPFLFLVGQDNFNLSCSHSASTCCVGQVNYGLILGLVCSRVYLLSLSSVCRISSVIFSLLFAIVRGYFPATKSQPFGTRPKNKKGRQPWPWAGLSIYLFSQAKLPTCFSVYLHFAGGKWERKWLSFVFVKLAKTKLSRANKLWQLIKMNYVRRPQGFCSLSKLFLLPFHGLFQDFLGSVLRRGVIHMWESIWDSFVVVLKECELNLLLVNLCMTKLA